MTTPIPAPASDDTPEAGVVGRMADALSPEGALAAMAGTPESVRMVIEVARSTVLSSVDTLVRLEATDPRPDYIAGGRWTDQEGFYLALVGRRMRQVIETIGAVLALQQDGRHQSAWTLLGTAAFNLERLWMLTEIPVDDQPLDEVRRSTVAWTDLADALAALDSVAGISPHPFDTGYDGDQTTAEPIDRETAQIAGHKHWVELLTALYRARRLAQAHIPSHLHLGSDTVQGTGEGTGFDTAEMIAAQCEIAVAVIRAATASTTELLTVSWHGRIHN